MNTLEPATYANVEAFAISIGIGLLMGLERERKPDAKAGLRTFALTAMLGCLAALLSAKTGNAWLLAVGFLVLPVMMIVSLAQDPQDDGDPGTTSVVALMLCYGLGALVWHGHATLAVMLAITTTILLYFKGQLQNASRSLTHKDLISILQFGVLSLVVLPILPNQDYGPYLALNPHQIWWMVVLISGLSLAGYAALRFVGNRHGAPLLGFFGGLVSSTATTMVFARNARDDAKLTETATLVILIANLVVIVRIGIVAAVLAPTLVVPLAGILGIGLLFGLIVAVFKWRTLTAAGDLPLPEVKNPTEIRTALTFGLLYGAVLLLSAWLQDIAGSQGLYLVALASGLTDVDAITLSTLRLFNQNTLTANPTVVAIGLASLSNLIFKSGLVIAIGGKPLARRALPGLAAIGVGFIAGIVVLS
ncbi:MAG: MgtC/SapB family protein [Rhodocyclaceae bacterium]|nr:MgtC/SapB family protein [Rhodocyclaceae bacterium]MDZ4215594.1 MgtC/SapB family protein [Rhodocyclaceae bacterium]